MADSEFLDFISDILEGEKQPEDAKSEIHGFVNDLLDNAVASEMRPDNWQRTPFEFRGENKKFFHCTDDTVLIAGPAESGKTSAALTLLHYLCLTNDKLRCVLARAVREDMSISVIPTFVDKILPEIAGDGLVHCVVNGKEVTIKMLGGVRPNEFHYSNGSKIWCAGFDRDQKILSGEYDVVLINQAEEIDSDTIDNVETRVTGRAGNIKTRNAQLLMDCNPGGQDHHLLRRSQDGRLTMFRSLHRDNPFLYDSEGNKTQQGERTMARLERLRGVKRQRLLLGNWVGREGLFFDDFDPEIHALKYHFKLLEDWEVWGSIDYGYNHWNAIYLHAKDNDGLIYTFDEFAHRKRKAKQVAPEVQELIQQRWNLNVAQISFYGGSDIFAETGNTELTVAQQYAQFGFTIIPTKQGPGSREARAQYFLTLLGSMPEELPENYQDLDPNDLDILEPKWFYNPRRVKYLPTCLQGLVADPRNMDRPKKQDCDADGYGGDDFYDGCTYGLYLPDRDSFHSQATEKLKKLREAKVNGRY